MDLSKLRPAPWTYEEGDGPLVVGADGFPILLPEKDDYLARDDVKFCALARNAFDGDPEALAWWEANRRKRDG